MDSCRLSTYSFMSSSFIYFQEGVKFPCDQCDYKATQKGDLLKHIKSLHEGVKIPCGQCDYKATEKGHLLRHVKSKHKGL